MFLHDLTGYGKAKACASVGFPGLVAPCKGLKEPWDKLLCYGLSVIGDLYQNTVFIPGDLNCYVLACDIVFSCIGQQIMDDSDKKLGINLSKYGLIGDIYLEIPATLCKVLIEFHADPAYKLANLGVLRT